MILNKPAFSLCVSRKWDILPKRCGLATDQLLKLKGELLEGYTQPAQTQVRTENCGSSFQTENFPMP